MNALLLAGALLFGQVDDSDLSAPRLKAAEADGPFVVTPLPPRSPGRLTAVLPRLASLKLDGKEIGPDSPAPAAGKHVVSLSLDNKYWSFGREWKADVVLPAGGAHLGELSAPSELAVLHATYLKALDFLTKEGDISWWDQTLTVKWPSDGDWFSPWSFSLNISNARAWDVALHELGHAVMHKAMRAQPAGGSHKIDECYSPQLAWSEGWATFFAAAVWLDRGDPDAKFEFLVPRRAPIRLENVPEDVCRGQGNEWRVAAGFWDLYDTHPDHDDNAAFSFRRLWQPLRGARMGSAASAWELISAGMNPLEKWAGQRALAGNTLVEPPAPPALASWD